MILAPLRGVTIRAFREAFARPIAEAGFTEAFMPFIPALAGFDPLKDRELRPIGRVGVPLPTAASSLRLTPQFIGKDPAALRACLLRVRDAGFETADLNAGCPYPMVRNKGRGSGLLQNPDTLMRLLEVGCATMGTGRFSLKTRLGVNRPDELAALMPRINSFPLRFLTVHARTARQMYEGAVDRAHLREIEALSAVPVVENGDIDWREGRAPSRPCMVGRSFIRSLGERDDIGDLLAHYIEASRAELSGDAPVLGRMKELLSYWKDLPRWHRRWNVVKIARTLDELRMAIALPPKI